MPSSERHSRLLRARLLMRRRLSAVRLVGPACRAGPQTRKRARSASGDLPSAARMNIAERGTARMSEAVPDPQSPLSYERREPARPASASGFDQLMRVLSALELICIAVALASLSMVVARSLRPAPDA